MARLRIKKRSYGACPHRARINEVKGLWIGTVPSTSPYDEKICMSFCKLE